MSEELTAKYFKKREALNVRCNQKSTTIRKKNVPWIWQFIVTGDINDEEVEFLHAR